MPKIKVYCWDENCKPRPFLHELNVGGVVVASAGIQRIVRNVVREFMLDDSNDADRIKYGTQVVGDSPNFIIGAQELKLNQNFEILEGLLKQQLTHRLDLTSEIRNIDDTEYIPVVCPNQHLNYISIQKDKKQTNAL